MSRVTASRLQRTQVKRKVITLPNGKKKISTEVVEIKAPTPRKMVFAPTDSFSGKGILEVASKDTPLGVMTSEGQEINWAKYQKRRARKDAYGKPRK